MATISTVVVRRDFMIELINIDCVEAMKLMPDKAFDLAIVDPPYGIGEDGSRGNPASSKWKNPAPTRHTKKAWDKKRPTREYWQQLFRVTKNQVVWGGNYFTEHLPPKMGWIFWDKKTGDSDYSDGELAFTSFDRALKKIEWMWNGFRQQEFETRIHPTQKPVRLYEWILTNYAKPGERILDTHGGSLSIAIACHNLGFDLTACEIDQEYFEAGKCRLEEHQKQGQLFVSV